MLELTQGTMEDCQECGKSVPETTLTLIVWAGGYDAKICSDCKKQFSDAGTCDNCEETIHPHHNDWTVYTYNGDERWCESCRNNSAWECDDCGGLYSHETHIQLEIDNGASVCEHCSINYYWCDHHDTYETDPCQEESNLHDYGYKPRPNFHASAKEVNPKLFFGIELETEMTSGVHISDGIDILYLYSNEERNFYMKEDGSLHNGIEIVSHPRTLASWTEYATMFATALDAGHKYGVRAWHKPNCGMHIHCSRSGFRSDAHTARFGLLFARNAGMWQHIAGRVSAYASFGGLSNGQVIEKAKVPWRANHSDAINYSPDSTIEVRIWRPSMCINRVMASIQFTAAAVEYTRHMPMGKHKSALHWAAFVHYLQSNSETYPDALAVLNGQGFQVTDTYTPTITYKENN